MHRYASSPFFFLYFRILLTFQADQTPVAVSSLGMLLRSPFGGTLCLLLCYRRYDHHRIAHAFPVYYTSLACASHHTLCLLLCYRRYSSQPGHCDCELLAALLSVVSRGIFTETSRQPTEPLSVRPLHAPRAALPPPHATARAASAFWGSGFWRQAESSPRGTNPRSHGNRTTRPRHSSPLFHRAGDGCRGWWLWS